MDSPILLDETSFDVIIYGTGLVETYLSAALSVAGKKVLHLEENEYYGSSFATHPYKSYTELLNGPGNASRSNAPETLPPNSSLYTLPKRPNMLGNCSSKLFNPNSPTTEPEETANQENQQTAETESKQDALHAEFMKDSRKYNFDVSSTVMWARGKDLSNMVVAGTHRYIEFHCIKQSMCFTEGQVIPAPVTKKDIFRSKDISLVEKRNLMRFVQNVMQEIQESNVEGDKVEDESKDTVECEEDQNISFVEYMQRQNLSPKLQSFILYIVCLCSSATEANELAKTEGMERVHKYQASSGVYGATPFLYPLYGISEINQGYSRLGAVNTGIFILNRAIDSIVLDEQSGNVKGIICDAGQFLEAPTIVTSARYVPNANAQPLASRFIAVTDKLLHEDHSLIHIVVPPDETREKTVFVSQLDASTFVCPTGKYVVHLTCDAHGTAQEDLQRLVEQLLRTGPDSDAEKPNALFQSYFTLMSHTAPEHPNGVILCPEHPRSDTGLEKYLQSAEELFHQIVGDEIEFFPKRPDPNEQHEAEDDIDI